MAFVAEETLATRSRVRAPKIGLTNGAVDQSEVGDSRVLLDDLRVDDRRENDVDALRCARPQHDLHPPTLIGSPDALLLVIGCAAATTTSSCSGRASERKQRSIDARWSLIRRERFDSPWLLRAGVDSPVRPPASPHSAVYS